METAREPDATTWTEPEPDWETNDLLQGETNELETAREPDTTTWTEPDTYLRKI